MSNALRDALTSSTFACPGDHRLDGVRGDRYEYADEMADEMGFPVDWNIELLAVEHPEEWKALQKRQHENWVERGSCKKPITIELEYEGDDYSTYCYPVASGACVEALGLDEDEDYSHALWAVFSERRRLAKILNESERLQALTTLEAAV